MCDVQLWMSRESDRFAIGEYKRVPWNDLEWYYSGPQYHKHFAHVSTADNAMLSYTPNDEFGVADRQIRMKPGKYLRKFFDLSDQQIEHAVGMWKARVLVVLNIAMSPEDITLVYQNGPGSCMSGQCWDTPVHPCSIYGAGDLGVAYIGDIMGCDGRSLVWPEHMLRANSTYGDWETMSSALKDAGYKTQEEMEHTVTFTGARLLKVEYRGGLVLPYCDVCDGVQDKGGHLILVNSGCEVYANSTCGYSPQGDPCERCEETTNADDLFTVENCGEENWCEYCRDEYSFYCENCECTVALTEERVIFSASHNAHPDTFVCETCRDECAWQCVECENHYSNDVKSTEYEGDEVCPRCYEANPDQYGLLDEEEEEEDN